MINPELEESNKVEIPMQNVQDKTKKKRKIRFLCYFCCIFFSFVFIRIILVFYLISQIDFNSFYINQLKYNTDNSDSIFLDACLENAFSPLNAQVVDGVINLYSVNTKSKRELLAEMHLPSVELEKYKNFRFKGDITFRNINASAILNFCMNKHKYKISLQFDGIVWFRFCLIKFKLSQTKEHTKEFTKNEEETENFLHLKKTICKNNENSFELKVVLESVYSNLFEFLYIKTENIQIHLGGDLPFHISIPNQDIHKGRILDSLEFSIVLEKSNFFILRNSLSKFLDNSKISAYVKDIKIGTHNPVNFPLKIYFHECIQMKSLFRKKKKKSNNIYTEPILDIREIKSESNSIMACIYFNPGCFPIISQETEFLFYNCDSKFNVNINGANDLSLKVHLKNMNEFIRMNVTLQIDKIQNIVDSLVFDKCTLNIVASGNTQFFQGMSLLYDGQSLRLNFERSHVILYKKSNKRKKKLNRTYDIKHKIHSETSTISIESILDNTYSNENIKFLYIRLPTFSLNISSDLYQLDLKVFENDFAIYEDLNFNGLLQTLIIFKTKVPILLEKDLDEIINTTLTLKCLKDVTAKITLNEIFNKDQINEDSTHKYLEINDLKLKYLDMLNLNTGLMKFSLKNISNLEDYASSGFIINNYFDLNEKHGLNFLIGDLTYDFIYDLKLLENMKFVVILKNFKPTILIQDCKFSFSLKSIDHLRGIFRDKFKFGVTDRLFTNFISQLLNKCLNTKGGISTQIKSILKLELDLNTELKRNIDLFTTANIKLRIEDKIAHNFKLGDFIFKKSELKFFTIYGEEICSIIFYKIVDTNGTSLNLNIKISDSFFKEKDVQFKYFYDEKLKDTINNYDPELFMRIIRSFFVQLHIKDKIIESDEPRFKKFPILNINYDNLSYFEEDKKNLYLQGQIEFISDGLRNFIRYKLNLLLSKFFNCVPDILDLTLNIGRLDIFSLFLYDKTDIPKINILGKTHLYGSFSHSSFILIYTGEEFDQLLINDMRYHDRYILEMDHNSLQIYSIRINFNALVGVLDQNKIYAIDHVKLNYQFIFLLMEIFKDDENIGNNVLKFCTTTFEEIRINCGLNININPINNLKLKIFNDHIVYFDSSFIINSFNDGYFRINIRNLHKVKVLWKLVKCVNTFRDCDIILYDSDTNFKYKFNCRMNFFTYSFLVTAKKFIPFSGQKILTSLVKQFQELEFVKHLIKADEKRISKENEIKENFQELPR